MDFVSLVILLVLQGADSSCRKIEERDLMRKVEAVHARNDLVESEKAEKLQALTFAGMGYSRAKIVVGEPTGSLGFGYLGSATVLTSKYGFFPNCWSTDQQALFHKKGRAITTANLGNSREFWFYPKEIVYFKDAKLVGTYETKASELGPMLEKARKQWGWVLALPGTLAKSGKR